MAECPDWCPSVFLEEKLHSVGALTVHSLPCYSFFSPPLPSKVQVLYGGTDLFDYEVRKTFNNDMLLAFISSSCIAVLVYILTSCSGKGCFHLPSCWA